MLAIINDCLAIALLPKKALASSTAGAILDVIIIVLGSVGIPLVLWSDSFKSEDKQPHVYGWEYVEDALWKLTLAVM